MQGAHDRKLDWQGEIEVIYASDSRNILNLVRWFNRDKVNQLGEVVKARVGPNKHHGEEDHHGWNLESGRVEQFDCSAENISQIVQVCNKGPNHKLVAPYVPKVEHDSCDVVHLHLFPIVHFFDKKMSNKVAKMVSKSVKWVI